MKRRERLMLAAVFFFWFSVYTYPSFLSSYAEQALGASSVMVGMIAGSYGFTQMILRIPLGIFSDIFRKRKVFVMGGFCAAIIASAGLALVSVLAPNGGGYLSALALVFRGFSGMAAATWVNFSVMYSSMYTPEEAGNAMGKMMLPQYLSQVSAMLIGSYVRTGLGTTWAFLLATLGGIAGLIVISRVDDIVPENTAPFRLRSFVAAAKDRNLIMGTLLSMLLHLICWATILSFTQTWAKSFIDGFKDSYLGWLSVMYLVPNAVLSYFVGSWLRPKIGRKAVLVIGFAVVGIACAMFTLSLSTFMLMLSTAVFGVGMGLVLPVCIAAAIETVAVESRGAAMGIYQALYGVGMFIGPVIAGAIIDSGKNAGNAMEGYRTNFWMCVGLSALGIIITLVMDRKKNR